MSAALAYDMFSWNPWNFMSNCWFVNALCLPLIPYPSSYQTCAKERPQELCHWFYSQNLGLSSRTVFRNDGHSLAKDLLGSNSDSKSQTWTLPPDQLCVKDSSLSLLKPQINCVVFEFVFVCWRCRNWGKFCNYFNAQAPGWSDVRMRHTMVISNPGFRLQRHYHAREPQNTCHNGPGGKAARNDFKHRMRGQEKQGLTELNYVLARLPMPEKFSKGKIKSLRQ